MKCPILEIGWMQTKVGDKGVSSDCLKKKCAWWEQKLSKCAIKAIALEIRYVYTQLSDITKELTLLRPPRK